MDIEKLQNLISKGLTQREIANQVGCSQGNIKYWLAKFDLKTKACEKREIKCKLCGETNKDLFYVHKDGRVRYRCKNCDNKETIKRFRNYKRQAVEYKGGKCVKCGYNKCLGSMDFHHLDSKQKDLNWERMRKWSFEKIKKELDKCILVCRNCHGEIHYEVDLGG